VKSTGPVLKIVGPVSEINVMGWLLSASLRAYLLIVALGWSLEASQLPGQTTTGSITGRVVDGATGTPIAGARVNPGSGPSAAEAHTDENGRFILNALPAGQYPITTWKNGYDDFGSVGKKLPHGPTGSIGLLAGQHLDGIVIPMWRRGILRGRVRDEAGRPLKATVRAFLQHAPADARTFYSYEDTWSDDRGNYNLPVAPGEYVVAAVLPSMGATVRPMAPAANGHARRYVTTFYPRATALTGATRLSVTSGETRASVDIQLASVPSVEVSGTVNGTRASVLGPLSIRVQLFGPPDAMPASIAPSEVLVAPDGSFSLTHVPPGEYTLGATRIWRAADTSLPDPEGLYATTPIHVGETEVSGLALTLRRGASVSGTVTFDGAASARSAIDIDLEPADSDARRFRSALGQLTADHRFSVPSAAPGRYVLRVNGGDWRLKSATLNGRDISDDSFEIGTTDISNVLVVLTADVAKVNGVVRDRNGELALDAWVLAFPMARAAWTTSASSRRIRTARLSAGGRYSLVGIPAGAYFIVAVNAADLGAWPGPTSFERFSRSATVVVLADAEEKTVDLREGG
jgi:hypothetical protein